MIQQLIQHLDSLQVDLTAIDPAHDIDAADRVAAIVFALRRACDETGDRRLQVAIPTTVAEARQAA